ncbi:putative lipopolysaccharide heptosyltransferase III [Vibrio sp. LaRot3]|uniref:putative lipopolysaccharide heptosyltransferase III n=1 Tax=Vibrio sp. LaRot3 TaxID=2998829 RepID=UPI0022CDC7C8|nr:putative lipopolysaccharide heptosyltransferase III [Vibrio sp. LaRot3]MDA0149389.1 putative lipopolysaccharide heptosyltransferase III [Vibrio sp. LaRot3]
MKRVLVIKLRHHGDVLLTSPVFKSIKAAFPDCIVDALVYQDTKPMLDKNPYIDNIYTIDKKWKALGIKTHLKYELDLLKQLKLNRYDTSLHLTESYRGMWINWFCDIPQGVTPQHRKRDKNKLWKKFFQHRYPVVPLRHTVEKHLDSLRCIGIQPNQEDRKLGIYNIDTSFLEELYSHGQLTKEDDYILVHPTSRWLFKCWDEEKVARTINHLAKDGYNIVLSAAPDKKEMQMIEKIKQHIKWPIIDASGQLTLSQLTGLIANAKLLFGVDSVPMHIAAATQTPSVCLFGPSGDKEWGPWMTKSTVLTSPYHHCRPCGKDGCAGSKISDCITSISERTVLEAIYNYLDIQNVEVSDYPPAI